MAKYLDLAGLSYYSSKLKKDLSKGSSYIFVGGNGTPQENALELQAAYNEAKSMPRYLGQVNAITDRQYYSGQTCSAGSSSYKITENYYGKLNDMSGSTRLVISDSEAKAVRTTVIVAPGSYTFIGDNAFVADASGINVISLTGEPDVYITSSVIMPSINLGMTVDCNNATFKGINCLDRTLYVTSHQTSELTFINCIATGNIGFGVNAQGTYINCVGGSGCFGGAYSGYYGTGASGTFIDCVGDSACFGGGTENVSASGMFIRCTGDEMCFGGSPNGQSTSASGTFIDCVGGSGCFASSNGTITTTARLYSCRLTNNKFPTPESGSQGSGKLILCIDKDFDIVTVK